MRNFSSNFNRGDLVKVIKPGILTSGAVGKVLDGRYSTEYAEGLVLVEFGFGEDSLKNIPEFKNAHRHFRKELNRKSFAYNPKSLELVNSLEMLEGNNMKEKLEGYINVVRVSFDNNEYARIYDFADYGTYSISPGDLVVVDTCHNSSLGFSLAIVRQVIPVKEYEALDDRVTITSEVAAIANMEPYKQRLELRKQKKDLFKKIKAKADSMKEIQYFELLAEKDPEMAEMLKQYKDM